MILGGKKEELTMGEYDTYIDAICEKDELGTLPPLDNEPEYDADAETWGLYFEYSDPYTKENDLVCLHFDDEQDACLTAQRIREDRISNKIKLEEEKAKKALDKQG